MTSVIRLAATLLLSLTAVSACAAQQAEPTRVAQAQPSQQQEEFVPIDQLPPTEQLAAAPLLVGAYAFVLAVLFVYVATVSRRLSTIQREVDRLESEVKRAGRG
jgi:CcmD family protein